MRGRQNRLMAQIAELERKAREARRAAAESSRTYMRQCSEMGISSAPGGGAPSTAREGLRRKVEGELPGRLREVVRQLRQTWWK